MANTLDYVDRYGHLKFERKAFNDVDNLVFSLLSYLDFSECNIGNDGATVEQMGRHFLMHHTYKQQRAKGIAQGDAYLLLEKVVEADRYRNIVVTDYIYNTNRRMMFSAMVFHITRRLDYIAFEGTDEQISGWREDFELAHTFPVPSQIEAIKYVNEHTHFFGPKVIIGGHSKGGNLALVGAMKMKRIKWLKVQKVYNNDGPGLRKAEFESDEYERVKTKYAHIVPHCSIVGMMMRNDTYRVVQSDKENILGHSILTWQVSGDHLVRGARSEHSKEIERRLWHWLDTHNDEQRKKVTDAVFGTIEGCNITDTMSLAKLKNIVNLIKRANELDKESRDLVLGLLKDVATKA
ncbi:MAG: DUF2974 domain-containing protein [Candidatus Saccharibacteria bacterium]|nr:DUF2974 domain-containing protein [Candidatus Saccharibacteria bacterium]